eukprot:scaffold8457_cov112-Isochrysis_galbana.AAC.9
MAKRTVRPYACGNASAVAACSFSAASEDGVCLGQEAQLLVSANGRDHRRRKCADRRPGLHRGARKRRGQPGSGHVGEHEVSQRHGKGTRVPIRGSLHTLFPSCIAPMPRSPPITTYEYFTTLYYFTLLTGRKVNELGGRPAGTFRLPNTFGPGRAPHPP